DENKGHPAHDRDAPCLDLADHGPWSMGARLWRTAALAKCDCCEPIAMVATILPHSRPLVTPRPNKRPAWPARSLPRLRSAYAGGEGQGGGAGHARETPEEPPPRPSPASGGGSCDRKRGEGAIRRASANSRSAIAMS